MRRIVLLAAWLCFGFGSLIFAQEVPLDLGQFRLEVDKGAEAHMELTNDGANGAKAIVVTVSKPGPEFWSVELRAPGINFEGGKHYELTFRAKSSPKEYVYLVPEKVDGNQASVAEGTTLEIPEEWTDCTVVFDIKDPANPGRLTISSLSVNQSTFWFSDFKLTEK
jgi:carbohydrate binding protein with CBM4/9 domain